MPFGAKRGLLKEPLEEGQSPAEGDRFESKKELLLFFLRSNSVSVLGLRPQAVAVVLSRF